MLYNNFDHIINKARKEQKRHVLAVACAEEHHVLKAVIMASKENISLPYLIGDAEKIRRILSDIGECVPDDWIIPAANRADAAAKAVEMIRTGRASFLMKGLIETSDMLRAVLNKETGISTGGVLSHVSLTYLPAYSKILAITDAAMIIEPDLPQKKHIIQNAVKAMRTLGCECPKVAVLTALEKVNPKMQDTIDADTLKQLWQAGEITDCIVEGPIAMDLALNKEAAEIKNYESPVAGCADILIMPNMVTGNILSKALREFADSTVVGVVMGAKAPMILTSRGASVRTKYTSIVVVSDML